MTNDADRLAGYADALDAAESLIRQLLKTTDARNVPGLEVALTVVGRVRTGVPEYHRDVCDLHDQHVADWGDLAESEAECVPCLAETAPHTCVQEL